MPTINSPSNKTRNFNILAEIHAGKPNKQAVAIGYAIQRKAKAAGRK